MGGVLRRGRQAVRAHLALHRALNDPPPRTLPPHPHPCAHTYAPMRSTHPHFDALNPFKSLRDPVRSAASHTHTPRPHRYSRHAHGPADALRRHHSRVFFGPSCCCSAVLLSAHHGWNGTDAEARCASLLATPSSWSGGVDGGVDDGVDGACGTAPGPGLSGDAPPPRRKCRPRGGSVAVARVQ